MVNWKLIEVFVLRSTIPAGPFPIRRFSRHKTDDHTFDTKPFKRCLFVQTAEVNKVK